jgi:hypothetical protein
MKIWDIAKEHYKGWHLTLSAKAKAYNTYEERMSHKLEELDIVEWHSLLKYFRSAKFQVRSKFLLCLTIVVYEKWLCLNCWAFLTSLPKVDLVF